MYPTGIDWWACHAQNKEPTLIQVQEIKTQQDRRKRALEYVTQKRNCIDIGSNVGFWTRDLAKEFEKVYCFEPNAIFRECFLKNLPQDNIELFTYGLSDREHTATQSFNSTVIQDIPGNVECRPLDSFFLSDIDFIKIDVDGFEIQVLSGAIKTLQENNPVINIEMKRNKRPAIVAESERILRSVGYFKKDCVKSDEIWLKSL